MPDLKEPLRARGLLRQIVLPPAVDALLGSLQPDAPVPAGADVRGTASLGVSGTPLGFLSLDLRPPGPSIPFHLVSDEAAGSFRLWLVLSATPPAKKLFGFAAGLPGAVLKPATLKSGGGEEWLEPAAGDVALAGAAVTLLIEGRAGQSATMELSPTDGQPAGLITFGLDPPAVLLGSTGFGLELPDGVTLDDSDQAVPPGHTVVAGRQITTQADTAAWRGLVARKARFFLPRGVPFFGGHAVDAYVEVTRAPGHGIDLAVSTKWRAPGNGKEIDVLIECRDPAATGLQDFLPTLVEASLTLPVEKARPSVNGQGFTMLAGKPVVARVRFARTSSDPTTRMTLALESQGENGVLSVVSPAGGPAAHAVISAAALATAIVAEKPPPGADVSGVGLNALLAVALGLSSLLKDEGQLVLHAVELDSEGHGLPVGGTLALKLDYTVDVRVKPVTVGVLAIKMSDEQPMRVRNRNVRLTIHPERTGLDIFELDFSRADMEIEDPGGWLINSPGSLFDILGTRSGRGSMWLEVDLRFKLNLGPVKVSGATIRAVRDDSGFSASLRGLDASLDVPGVIEGRGSLQLTPAGGVAAVLDASLVPLNLAAGATVAYEPHGDSFELYLRVGVDLPGPIPIANTGLGLYGVAGAFGVNAKPVIHDPDPIKGQLKWNSSDPASFGFAKGDLTIGVEAVIGTVPDLGFSFSARGGVFLTVPDIAIRGALLGRVLSPRLRVFDRPSDAALGVSFKGIVVVDGADGVTVALEGKLEAPPLLEVVVPLGAHFPFSRPGVEASDWFIHLGADGFVNPKPDGRAIGPIRAKVLPELVPVSADAYLMQRGKGIEKWPRGEPGSITIKDGLLLAFGFGFDYTLGVRPLAWADVHASADILLATRPLLLAGFGDVGGSLNLGPFSMGVEADLRFLVCENADPYLHARLCGRIDLFFTDIEGCVEISIHNEPAKSVPFPDVHPLDRVEHGDVTGDLAFLIDDRYRRVAPLARDPAHAPTVWPDTLLHLGFGVSPSLAPGYAGGQFAGIDSYPSGLAAKPIGSDMLEYDWTLRRVALFDVTGNPTGAGTHVPGPLSAAWQLGKDGDLGVRPQAGDLVLLTYQGDLWLNRLADGGASIPGDPLSQAGKYCQGDAAAGLGWALGWGATGAAAQLLLPPAELWPDPTVSRFTATVRLGCSGLKGDPILGPRTVLQLPPPFDYRAPSTAPLAPPVDLERAFEGFLDLGGVGGEREFANTALVQPSEPLDDARLWLVVRNADDQQPTVIDDLGRHWRGESRHLDSGRTALRFAPPAPGTIRHVLVLWTSDTWLAVLGLGGVTRSALAAAKARRDARAAEAARQQQAAAAQPQKAAQTTGGGVRCILQPGRLYRLDVAMSWSGTLSEQKEDGSTTVVASLTDQTKYRPKGAPPGGVDTARSFFFQTTKAPAPGAAVLPVKYGDSLYLALVHERQDLFDPALLVRHLGGYTPAQSEVDRFRDDPLQAHFRAGHVATLARAFGFDLDLGLRRIDVAGSEGNEQMLGAALLALAKPAILSKGDQRRFALSETAPCPTPKPGSTLEADRQLSERAWYEVYVVARARTSGVADGRLPGVTFRTSRWRAPADMLAALRFGAAHPGAPDGDVEVRESPPAPAGVIDGSDADFGVALRALGLEGWPLAEEPRASLLWVPAAGSSPPWRLAGVLLESPEAIDRPGRCEVRQLVAQPGGAAFDVRRSDRNRSRLLFLTTSPFAPGAAGTGATVVSLELLDRRTAAPLVGSLALPAQPSFAGEP